ncbi:MAG TPA: hypothetical protein VHL31_03465 [Geminicoccus sp.]|jgi:hypothetical protein|uniref:hypothetical protein n=1 Tax=Geminicoccus sp. TaxID=2024832 RepID=UPI002E323C5D|nr:hypothetical protein [Geminicoccus sp.]HEX2525346.1 hypothetical protein [Geminicoccus sp.]
MGGIPAALGRAVYAEIDEPASGDVLAQAAAWLARLEPWFGTCRSIGITRHSIGATEVTVVSAGHEADSAIIVHLATGRPAAIGTRVRVEGAAATLQMDGRGARVTTKGQVLATGAIELPARDPARAAVLNEVLARALTSREVETVNG